MLGCHGVTTQSVAVENAADPPKVGADPGHATRTGGKLVPTGNDKLAAFADGCFWGVEDAFRHVPGVVATAAGYSGGHTENPTYEDVCTHTTGHAETVLVEYDPDKVSYGELLNTFWNIHDPTTLNYQGPDHGTQYRSVIFTHNAEQEKEALRSKEEAQRHFKKPIVTEIAALDRFWPAEDYHQRYVEKNGREVCKITAPAPVEPAAEPAKRGGLIGRLVG